MYLNNGRTPLYVVKRKFTEVYHTGSYSYATPKLYKIGNAKSVCKQLNQRYERHKDDTPTETFAEWRSHNKFRMTMKDRDAELAYESYVACKEGGPWIVAELQLAASEIKID